MLFIPEKQRLKLNYETVSESTRMLYDKLVTDSSMILSIAGETIVGLQYDYENEDFFRFVEVSTEGSKSISASHIDGLVFHTVISLEDMMGWVCIIQLDGEGSAKGVVFVNDSGVRVHISKAGHVQMFFLDTGCESIAAPKKATVLEFPKA